MTQAASKPPTSGRVRPVSSTFLVVWTGDDDTPPLVDNEGEAFSRYVEDAPDDVAGADQSRDGGTSD